MTRRLRKLFQGILTIGGAMSLVAIHGAAADVSSQEFEALKTQNQNLQDQVAKQQRQIDELRRRLDGLQKQTVG